MLQFDNKYQVGKMNLAFKLVVNRQSFDNLLRGVYREVSGVGGVNRLKTTRRRRQ
jgi:hypothetical protein